MSGDKCQNCSGRGYYHAFLQGTGWSKQKYSCDCPLGSIWTLNCYMDTVPERLRPWLDQPLLRETEPQQAVIARLNEWGRAWQRYDAPSLYVWGHPGRGKSVIGAKAARLALQTGAATSALFIKPIDLLARLRATFNTRTESTDAVLDEYSYVGLLLLDDLGTEVQRQESAWAAEQLFTILDRRYDNDSPIIVTSNFGPQHLSRRLGDYGPRFVDRLKEMTGGGKFTIGCNRLPNLRGGPVEHTTDEQPPGDGDGSSEPIPLPIQAKRRHHA